MDVASDGYAASLEPWTFEKKTVIEDIYQETFVEGPAGTRTSLLYYLKSAKTAAPNPRMSVPFKVFSEGKEVDAPIDVVSAVGGVSQPWDLTGFSGDYMGGASYKDGKAIVFVVPWSQNGALHFNTVRLGPKTSKPDLIDAKDQAPLEVNDTIGKLETDELSTKVARYFRAALKVRNASVAAKTAEPGTTIVPGPGEGTPRPSVTARATRPSDTARPTSTARPGSTEQPCPAVTTPKQIDPVEDEVVTESSPDLVWEYEHHCTPDAFLIQLSREGEFVRVEEEYEINGNARRFNFDKPLGCRRYYWRIRARDVDQLSDWATTSFIVRTEGC